MRFRRVLLVLVLITAVLAAEWLWLKAERAPSPGAGGPAITTHGQAPGGPFALVDHGGRAVSDQTYRGRYLVMVFGYTHCPDVCPTTLASVAAALDLMGPRAEAVQPIFVTVDPDRDTPAVLADYVAAIHPRLVGLTGAPARIRDVARDYRVYFSKVETGDDDYPVDHSAYVYVIGPDGGMLTYLRHDATPRAMAEAIERLMNRPISRRGPASAKGDSPAGRG